MDLPQAAADLINNPKSHGAITTINRDGSPQVTLVWIEVVDGKLSFNTNKARQKFRNLNRDPRVVVTVQNQEDPREYAAFHGNAVLVEEGSDEQIDRLANKYMGTDYPARQPGEERIRIDVDLQKIIGRGPWVG